MDNHQTEIEQLTTELAHLRFAVRQSKRRQMDASEWEARIAEIESRIEELSK